MIIFYLLVLILLFIPLPSSNLFNKGGYYEDYLKPEVTLPIKGLFVLLVFFRHSTSYLAFNDSLLDSVFLTIDHLSFQLIVALFLFYSGFGIYESIKIKGHNYIKDFPRKRLLKTWFHFAICVLIYLLFNIIANKQYPVKTILLSFIGWESIGNSNWYMFVTFSLYILLFLSFIRFKKTTSVIPFNIFNLLCVILIVVLYFFAAGDWWYNAIPCFLLGMWYSRYKSQIEGFVQKSGKVYFMSLLVSVFLFGILYIAYIKLFSLSFLLLSPLFSFIIVLITMKIKVKSKVLSYLGKHLFTIYMLQRLSFLMLSGMFGGNKYLYFIASLLLTIILSNVLDKGFVLLDKGIAHICCKPETAKTKN